MQKVGLLDELEQWWCTDKGQFNDRAVSKTYFSEQIACPFLEDESCSIYPVRPSICREYIVYSPPEYCVDPFTNSIERLHLSVCLRPGADRFMGGLGKHRPPKLVPMTIGTAMDKREFVDPNPRRKIGGFWLVPSRRPFILSP